MVARSQKYEGIIQNILKICNSGTKMELSRDYGGETLTIFFLKDNHPLFEGKDNAIVDHIHVGILGEGYNHFIDSLYQQLNSVVSEIEEKRGNKRD